MKSILSNYYFKGRLIFYMEREVSVGAMLGIVLIALAAIIALGFGIYGVAKGTASKGADDVRGSLERVSQQAFMDFDQRVVSGSQVISALKNFEGEPVAILISTKAVQNGQKIASKEDRPQGSEAYFASDGSYAYINYNAILAQDETGQPGNRVGGGEKAIAPGGVKPEIQFKNGYYVTNHGFALDNNGAVRYETTTAGIYKSGNAEYIASTAKFQANLLTDQSGTIMGVVFRQL